MKPSLEDRQAITEILSRYGLLIDRQEPDEWLKLFLDDAVIEVPGRPAYRTGEDRRSLAEGAPRGLHLAAPPVIRAGGSDNAATGKSLIGWYEDELVKRGEHWFIARRAIHYFRA